MKSQYFVLGLLGLILVTILAVSLARSRPTTYPLDTPRCAPGPMAPEGMADWMAPHQKLEGDVEVERGGVLFNVPANIVRTATSPLSMNHRQGLFGIQVRAKSLPKLEGTACNDASVRIRVISASKCDPKPGTSNCQTEAALAYASKHDRWFDVPLEPEAHPNVLAKVLARQSVEEFIKNPEPTYDAMIEWQSHIQPDFDPDMRPKTVVWTPSPHDRLECVLPISGSKFSRHYFADCTLTRIYDINGLAATVEFSVRTRHFPEQAPALFYMADNFKDMFQLRPAIQEFN